MQEAQETQVQSLGQEDPLEKGMETHSSILVWRTPWTEEPDRLPSMQSQRESDMTEQLTHTHTHTHTESGPVVTHTGPVVTSAAGAKHQAF